MITVNKSKFIEIVRERLRVERQPRLAALDLAVTIANESNMPTAELVEQKRALRDVTEKPLDDLSLDELAGMTLDKALSL